MMKVLLIADEDEKNRDQIAGLFSGSDYRVITADSVDAVMRDVLKKEAKVVLLGSVFDDMPARDLIPILKQCDRSLTIILVSGEMSLALLRRLRREGIFYHALTPMEAEDREELVQAVKCAFDNVAPSES